MAGSLQFRSPEERKEIASRAGRNSARVLVQRNLLTAELIRILNKRDKGTGVYGREAIALALMTKAISGDLQAISLIFDRVEGKPLQTHEHEAGPNMLASAAMSALGAMIQALNDRKAQPIDMVDVSPNAPAITDDSGDTAQQDAITSAPA